MRFIKFSSVENTYRGEELDRARDLGINNWITTEKLHGSNIGFYFAPGKEPRIASRNGFTDDNFFGMSSSPTIQELLPRLELAANYLIGEFGCNQVIIYGELVGDGVQKGVFYGKEKAFYAFRISMLFYDRPGEEEVFNYPIFDSVCDKFDIPVAPFIFRGSLDDCLNISNAFDSLIAKIPDNICEGVVIQPVAFASYHTGSAVMFKNKNDKFLEKSRFAKGPRILDLDMEFVDSVTPYLTENLAQSIISKFGRNMSFIPLYMKEFNDEMVREIGVEYDDYKIEKKHIMGEFIRLVKPLLRV